ncbi:MAG: CocE/NonD family hydrolase [Candidatus Aminicenantes bacterium]|nr:CocE/NonD family hydrolase [Candidatus Aminicenantes bacterium]
MSNIRNIVLIRGFKCKSCSLGILLVFILVASGMGLVQPRYPKPLGKYELRVEKSVMVPMRDGVKLSTDIYFPVGAEGKLPVILVRTPYNKNTYHALPPDHPYNFIHMFVSHGYILAVQDCRGKFESEGDYIVSAADTEDGYDAVTWAATQPWSSGNVGAYGCSYLGEDQIEMAKLQNPHLKCMIPQAAGGALGSAGGRYRPFGFLTGGAVELASALGWFYIYGSKVYWRPPANVDREEFLRSVKYFNPAPDLPDIDFFKALKTLPVLDMMKNVGAPPTDFEDFVSHQPADAYWNQFGYITDSDRFDVPTLHINSWYDGCVAETLYLFNLFQKNAESERCRDNQFVIIAPTTHCASETVSENTVVGERNLGDARFNYWGTYLKWFDYWLKGEDNGITEMSKVHLYVMGKNEWRGEKEWPLARTKYTSYYFHSDGHANSRYGTGKLDMQKPENESPDRFVYDPRTPVPTAGGPICSNCTGRKVPDGAFDQAEVEIRQDVLVYSTPALEKGVEVTGPVKVVLYVSSSARDTDFTAKLVDVTPEGQAFIIQEGILRARYREGFDKRVWMKPDEVYKLEIDLHATSNYFGKGHRIRVQVTSSNFPRFDRNLNTGGNNFDETEYIIAKNTVHHSKKYPSHIVLPLIPE